MHLSGWLGGWETIVDFMFQLFLLLLSFKIKELMHMDGNKTKKHE